MLRVLSLYSLLFVLVSACGTTRQQIPSTEKFAIEILQGRKIYTAEDSPITLEREPFKLRITLNGIAGIYFSAAMDRYYYDIPDDQDIFMCNPETYQGPCVFVAPKSMAEERFNTDQDLVIGDENRICYWSYSETRDWHRFDQGVTKKGNKVIAYRTVTSLHYPSEERVIGLDEIAQDIYIVAAAQAPRTAEEFRAGASGKELQREKMVLRFE